MLYVIGIKNCNKVRDTRSWLKGKDVDYEFIDLKKEPLTRGELEELEFKVGLDVLINKRGTTFRNLGLKDKELTDAEYLQLLEDNQSMIKRPILIKGEAVLVGYDEDAFEAFIQDDDDDDEEKEESSES